MPCDVLVFAPHPDDAEIHCGGTIAAHVRRGRRVVVVDATRGELGSRGSAAERAAEADAAAAALGLQARENLDLPDGHLRDGDLDARARIIAAIRRWRPAAVLSIHDHARHPDHLALARLVRGAVKGSALHKLDPGPDPAWGGARLWCYEAELPIDPDLLVPLTDADWAAKMAAIRCYGSQLHRPGADGPATTIATPAFVPWIEARGRAWGQHAGAPWAEAFTGPEHPRVADLTAI